MTISNKLQKATLLLNYIFCHPKYFFGYLATYWRDGYVPKITFLNEEELKTAIRSGKSIIRMGDGEMGLMNGNKIHYQKADTKLAKILKESVTTHTTHSSYVIGISEKYMRMTNKELREQKLLRCVLPLKLNYNNFFPKNVSYADSHMFYKDGAIDAVLGEELKGKKIIIVTKAANIKELTERGLDKVWDVTFVETAETDSFSQYDILLEQIKNIVKTSDGECRVILATGPCSKALAYNLGKVGIISYDVGLGLSVLYSNQSIEKLI